METLLTAHDRILNSALALYSKYGLKSVTMDDLCRELGISKKTLYQHVEDKNDLIRKVMEYEKQIQEEETEKMSAKDMNAIDELIHVNKKIHASQNIHSPTFYFDLKKFHQDIYYDWLDYKRKMMFELIIKNLKKGIMEGFYRDDLDLEIISKLHMARTEMMHTSDIITEDEFAKSKFIDEVFNYHIHGICNEVGLAYFKSRESEMKTK
jgi:AcrR family transcriptional regulator